LDDDCDGIIDTFDMECYTGPIDAVGRGLCESGLQSCAAGEWSEECVGEVLPVEEICDELDNDCDGQIDEEGVCGIDLKIAFSSNRDGNYEIYLMKPDGSEQGNLTNHRGFDWAPSLSPDGTRITFTSDRDGGYQIFVMEENGDDPTNLTQTGPDGYNAKSDWSPDGNSIVFHSFREGRQAQIYIMDADGSNQRRISDGIGADSHPSWSPGGATILFQSERNGLVDVFIMDVGGNGLQNLTLDGFDDYWASWSPDGRICYTSVRGGDWEIFMMDPNGANKRNLTNNPAARESRSSFSPDGSKVAYTHGREGSYEIYVMERGGNNRQNISNSPGDDIMPDWSH